MIILIKMVIFECCVCTWDNLEYQINLAYLDIVQDLYYQPAIDRSRPQVLEMKLRLPPDSVTAVSIEFDKVFLKYTEHRPDANRGFDVG